MAHGSSELDDKETASISPEARSLSRPIFGASSGSNASSDESHKAIARGDGLPTLFAREVAKQKQDLLGAFRSKRVVTPEGVRPAIVVVKSGRILEIAEWANVPANAYLRDYGNLILLPGLVDTHVHINEADETQAAGIESAGCASRRDWEGFQTATQAAAAGGITTLVDMPLNCVPETISVAALEAKRDAAAGRSATSSENENDRKSANQAWVDWMTWGGVVGNSGIGNEAELGGLIDAGVPGFKCFLVHSGIDGFAWVDEVQLRKTISVLNDPVFLPLSLPLLAHAELAGPIDRATQLLNDRGADWRSYQNYLASRPDESELEAIELLIRLSALSDAKIHIVHLSSAQALPAIRKAREAGLKITVETCPHYLWFAAEDISDGATEFKCAPPIRSAANREQLWRALRDGDIDMIATDHSPCPPELKNRDSGRFDQAWGGIASLGLALPIVWSGLLQREPSSEIGLSLLAKWMAAEPARLAGLIGKKGALAPGCDADITVFDPDIEWTVAEADLRFRHKLSPYLGSKLRGRVLETYLRGECIFQGQDWTTTDDPPMHDSEAKGLELRRVS